ncbi:MAG: phosphate butyryltransferase [Oscillospiraceae bacterium]|nr:phosphate butyryltransferase [Oscillospiraceae bacterium]
MIRTIDDIIQAAKEHKTAIVAVAAAHDDVVIEAVVNARREQLAEPILVGHVDAMRKMLVDLGEDPDSYRMIAADEDTESAAIAVSLCAEGKADFLMKGILSTADLMRAVFKRDSGLRTGRLTSHCMIYQIPAYHKLMLMTDGGVNTFPDLEKKADILENGAMALKALGYEKIYASCICGAETINPKVQSTLDAVELSNMTERWAPYNMTVIGPVALDLAVSKEACRHKRFEAEGAGDADIILVPNYEVGNGIGKATSLFGGSRSAGFIMGARVPIVLVSRSDNADSKMASIAAGSVLAANLKWD